MNYPARSEKAGDKLVAGEVAPFFPQPGQVPVQHFRRRRDLEIDLLAGPPVLDHNIDQGGPVLGMAFIDQLPAPGLPQEPDVVQAGNVELQPTFGKLHRMFSSSLKLKFLPS
jgi:hypothetical protein